MKRLEGDAWDNFKKIRAVGAFLFFITFVLLNGPMHFLVPGIIGAVAASMQAYICFKNGCKGLGWICIGGGTVLVALMAVYAYKLM